MSHDSTRPTRNPAILRTGPRECAIVNMTSIQGRSTFAELFDLAIEGRFANPELLGSLTAIAAHGTEALTLM